MNEKKNYLDFLKFELEFDIDYSEKKEIEYQKELEFLKMKNDIELLKQQILELNKTLNDRTLIFTYWNAN